MQFLIVFDSNPEAVIGYLVQTDSPTEIKFIETCAGVYGGESHLTIEESKAITWLTDYLKTKEIALDSTTNNMGLVSVDGPMKIILCGWLM